MTEYKISVIPGDGIGKEVIREGLKVLEAASEVENFNLNFIQYPYGSEYYLKTGELIPESDLREIKKSDAIFLGALGDPRVKTGILEQGILLKLRFYFDQYLNLRPVRVLPGLPLNLCPLRNKKPEDIDFIVIRENTEDFYVGAGGRVKTGKTKETQKIVRELYSVKFNLDIETDADEIAYQLGVVSKKGCERIIKYAFDTAVENKREWVASVDKANVITHLYGFWRDVFDNVSAGYPNIKTERLLVDAAAMFFVRSPERFDVVVAPNMFGDILTDIGAEIQGGMGTAPSGNINPNGVSMFEPIHGSAPDIAGKGIANPIATLWAGSMLLDSIGEKKAAKLVMKGIEDVLKEGKIRTPDFGGTSKTQDVGDAVAKAIRKYK